MTKRNGPLIHVDSSCWDCTYEKSERFICQADSGWYISCAHPDYPASGMQNRTTHSTPMQCPLLLQALRSKAESILKANP